MYFNGCAHQDWLGTFCAWLETPLHNGLRGSFIHSVAARAPQSQILRGTFRIYNYAELNGAADFGQARHGRVLGIDFCGYLRRAKRARGGSWKVGWGERVLDADGLFQVVDPLAPNFECALPEGCPGVLSAQCVRLEFEGQREILRRLVVGERLADFQRFRGEGRGIGPPQSDACRTAKQNCKKIERLRAGGIITR